MSCEDGLCGVSGNLPVPISACMIRFAFCCKVHIMKWVYDTDRKRQAKSFLGTQYIPMILPVFASCHR